MDYEGRLAKLRGRMDAEGIDVSFVTGMINVRYLCGFTGSTGSLLVGTAAARLFTDGRYTIQANQEVRGAEVEIYPSRADYGPALGKAAASMKAGRIGFEAGEVTVLARRQSLEPPEGFDRLETYFEGRELVPTRRWIEEIRMVKEPEEVRAIREAAALADRAFEFILDRIEPGRSELQVALDLEFFMRSSGAEAVSFPPIVASGARSALPHATPTERPVERGQYLLLDFGCVYEGYCSDLTRTVVVGTADDRQREIYELVLKAQEAGIEAARPGEMGARVHDAARRVFEEAGVAESFPHGLGHGVGLEIHEDPNLKTGYEDVLAPGHAITIEPGLYFEGWGGARIEDLGVVSDGGLELLSGAPKQMLSL